MARSTFTGVAIKGIAGAVPKDKVNNLTDHTFCPEEERKNIIALTGVHEYRRASPDICASDLCAAAASNLFKEMQIDPKSVDAVLFVSMTPDFVIPSTACLLQDKLGLPVSSIAYDINMGCSAYVVGLYNACALIQGGGLQRVLLLTGDTQTKLCHSEDKNVVFLLADGGAATLLEKTNSDGDTITIELETDGSGYDKLYVPAGGFRNPSTESTREVKNQTDGGIRSDEHIYMDGMEIFKFSSIVVVNSIKKFLDHDQLSAQDFDYLIMHQANKFMTDKIARKLKFPMEKVPYSLQVYGNTGSASIPLTVAHNYGEMIPAGQNRCLLSGFGVGLSWGTVDAVLDNIYCPPVTEL